MKTIAKTALRFVIIIGISSLVMGSGVAFLYAAFKVRLAERKAEEFKLVLKTALPEGEVKLLAGSMDAEDDVYAVCDAAGKPLAYAARGSGQGYSSKVKVLVGTKADEKLTISKVVVLEQQETPGLGTNVSLTRSTYTLWQKVHVAPADKPESFYNSFLDKFQGRTAERLGEVDAMVAATITSNATKNATREAVERIRAAIAAKPAGAAGRQTN